MSTVLPYASRGLPNDVHARVLRYLLLGWRPDMIAEECKIFRSTVYTIESCLLQHGSIRTPYWKTLGRPRWLTIADEDALFEVLLHEGWMYQDEIVHWLWYECSVSVSRSTVSRMLKRRGWNRKELRRIS